MKHREVPRPKEFPGFDAFESGTGDGVYIKDGQSIIEFILKHGVARTLVINEKAILPDKGRPLVIISAHGHLTATMPMMALVGKIYLDHGLGERIVTMYPHPAWYWLPGARRILDRGGALSNAWDVDALVDRLRKGQVHVTGTTPEALNCHFSYDEYVAPLRSGGMVAAAIRADAAVCLVAHQGGELWNLRLNLPFGLKVPFTGGLRGVNITLPPYRKIPYYGVSFKRYRPSISAAYLEKMTPRERQLAVRLELEKIRNQLILMTDQLKERMAERA
jgi:hypothetical protein